MTHYRYEIEGRGGDGQRFTVHGLLDLASDKISDAVDAAHKCAFEKLTHNHAVYGHPGKGGCKGPYQVTKMMIEKIG